MSRRLNQTLQGMRPYASKAISQLARGRPEVLNLAIGEPEFSPPGPLLERIIAAQSTFPVVMDSLKRYEQSLGDPALRETIARWYERRYDLRIDPDRQILVTHGGAEAIALALICTTQPLDRIALTDPTYMLYERSIRTLARTPVMLRRHAGEEELAGLLEPDAGGEVGLQDVRAFLINSPENPTGYVLSEREWHLLANTAERGDFWVIHDEVYDAMSFGRRHHPALAIDGLEKRSILVNSLSKKLGMPGLRIGWLVAPPEVIQIATKAHD